LKDIPKMMSSFWSCHNFVLQGKIQMLCNTTAADHPPEFFSRETRRRYHYCRSICIQCSNFI